MTPTRFERLTMPGRFRGRTLAALRLVLVDGHGIKAAARAVRIDKAAVSRAVAKLRELDAGVP